MFFPTFSFLSCVCAYCVWFLDFVYFCFSAAPVFLTELQSQDVPDGYPVSFDCVVIGKPPPSVRWYKDGKLLEENDHYMINEDQEGCHQLIITTVLPTDMGVYRCTAENSSGIAATKAELRVDSKRSRICSKHTIVFQILVRWGPLPMEYYGVKRML